jgi:ABC-2 type transport system permease protein
MICWRALVVPTILAGVAGVASSGCGPSRITAATIEAAVAPTFANLVKLQVSRLGLPPLTEADVAVTAICRREAAGVNRGSGDWTCTLAWHGPNRRPLRDTFELVVGTDGCYTAAVNGEGLGGPVLQGPDGRTVRNLLYTFEGCFDGT